MSVQNALNEELGREKIIHPGDYYFLNDGSQPRILVECGVYFKCKRGGIVEAVAIPKKDC